MLKYVRHWVVIVVGFIVIWQPLFGFCNFGQDTNKKKFNQVNKRIFVNTSVGLGITGMYTALSLAWYKSSFKQFRWFDDGREWLQLDKVGHGFGGYHLANTLYHAKRWAGHTEQQAFWWGTIGGFVLISPIEIFDGFSPDYGASVWDLAANASGSLLFVTNYLLWKEQRLFLKFSFYPTAWAQQNPRLLGRGHEQLLKDYNGQTYWLCYTPFRGQSSRWLPNWFAVAVGYGGEGMLGGYHKGQNAIINAREYRQFYLSLDVDLTQIKTTSRTLKTILFAFNIIRIPLPSVELNKHGLYFHPFGF